MLKYVKRYWYFAIWAPLFMIGEVVMDLTQPRLMSVIVDDGVLGVNSGGAGNMDIVIHTGILMICLVAVGGICGVLSGVFANLCSQNFAHDLRVDCFDRVMRLSFEQTDEFSTGSLVTRITNDVTQVQTFVNMVFRGFVRTFMLFAGGIYCMLLLDLRFSIVLACSLPLVIIFVIFFIAKANPKFKILQKKIDRVNSVMQENVTGARVVKAYVKEDWEAQRFKTANDELTGIQLYVLKLFSFMSPVTNIILNLSIVAIIYVGSIDVRNYTGVTTGEIMAAITYVSQILMAVLHMANLFQTASRAFVSSGRLREVLSTAPVIADGTFSGDTDVHGSVEFCDVSFAYPDSPDVPVLRNISLKIKPGETVGILGATGSGKSSLIQLIPRFYDCTSGEVLIDGVNVREYSLRSLRGRIAVAMQKSELFSRSIGENISWGSPDASDEEICDAAETAMAMEFITEKKDGFDEPVAEKGMSLSGGQKQRLSIARAVLRQSEILIFDDATSALDLKTEAQLYEALNRTRTGVTKIIVAQRIASVRDADRIIILDHGEIADIGSHEELLRTSSIYRDIYNSQLRR